MECRGLPWRHAEAEGCHCNSPEAMIGEATSAFGEMKESFIVGRGEEAES